MADSAMSTGGGTSDERFQQGSAADVTGEPSTAERTVALPDETYALRPSPPVRALAISSVTAVAGAILIVVATHPLPITIGGVLLAFGLLLAAAALIMTARLRSEVRLTATELVVLRGRRRQSLRWSDIARVDQQGHRLVAHTGEAGRELVITVPNRQATTYARLVDAIRVRLDKNRGYGAAF